MFAGIDTHKDTLAVAVVDAAGRQRAGVEVVNAAAGFAAVAELLAAQGVGRVGIEGSGAFGRAVAAYLAAQTRLDLREVPRRGEPADERPAVGCGRCGPRAMIHRISGRAC